MDFNNMIPDLDYYAHRVSYPEWEIKSPLFIDFIDISYFIDGQAAYSINDTPYIAKKGDLLCIPKGAKRLAHTIEDTTFEVYSINFLLRNRSGEDTTLPFPLVSHIGYIPELITYFHDVHDEWLQRAFGYELKIRSLLLNILYHLVNIIMNNKNPSIMDYRVKSGVHYVSEHFQAPITIGDMANMVGLNTIYYGSLFKENVGMTFSRYLNSVRLNYALLCLKHGEMTITEVAERCGFSDIFYFSRRFKEKFGVSPRQISK